MPFIYPHLALMPDAHLGLGATVGSVIPTLGAIMPAAVGVDIGCGMIAVKHAVHGGRPADATRKRAAGADRAGHPALGRRATTARSSRPPSRASPSSRRWPAEAGFDPASYAGNWRLQLGTLGSGNHFIEVSLDETDAVWLFLHSGSRGVGNKIAQAHIKVAQAAMKRWWIDAARPRPRLPRRGHAGVRPVHRRAAAGHSTSPCSTARR